MHSWNIWLDTLRERFAHDRQRLAEQTLQAYQRHGIAPLGFRSLIGALAQMPVLLATSQMLRAGLEQTRFPWIANLAKPDALLALLVVPTTACMTMTNPDMPEQTRLLLIAVPSVLAFVFALKFAAALSVHGLASTALTAIQTGTAHFVLARRVRSGKIRI